jgi:hypothetical protein
MVIRFSSVTYAGGPQAARASMAKFESGVSEGRAVRRVIAGSGKAG